MRPLSFGARANEIEQVGALVAGLGSHGEIPPEKHADALRTLRKNFVPVHRKRVDPKSTQVVTDENGEDVWVVGEAGEMPTSDMLSLAKAYDHLPPRFY